MRVIHFAKVATDPLKGFNAHGVRFVQLVDGAGEDETFVSCLHLEPGGWITNPPADRDTTVLVVHGAVTLLSSTPTIRLSLSCGMGIVMGADARYCLNSECGAILLVVEAERLEATEAGISTPERVMEAVWPGERENRPRRTVLSMVQRVYYWWKWRKVRRVARADISGWQPVPEGDVVAEGALEAWRHLLGGEPASD